VNDAIARDLVILASHLRRAAHSIDSLQREMREARKPGTISSRSDAADDHDFASITGEADRPLLWRDQRYHSETDSRAAAEAADRDSETDE